MATNTNNYGFKKPEENDFYSIEDQNRNWDLADTKMAQLNSDLVGRQNIVIKTVIVDPSGYNYVDIPAAGITSAWMPIAFNGDYNAWSGYVLGVNALNGNTLRVWLSAQRSGSTRINYCYLQIS